MPAERRETGREMDMQGRDTDRRIELPGAAERIPLYHHSLVAVSLILILGSLVQYMVSRTAVARQAVAPGRPSVLMTPGLVYTAFEEIIRREVTNESVAGRVLGVTPLLMSLASGAAWYFAARAGLGLTWGLWVGLFWVAHPAFVLLAPRPAKLSLVLLLLPVCWALLMRWRRTSGWPVALLLGMSMALLALSSLIGTALPLIVVPAMLTALSVRFPRRLLGIGLFVLSFVLVALAGATYLTSWLDRLHAAEGTYAVRSRMERDLWDALDTGGTPSISGAARSMLASEPAGSLPPPQAALRILLQASPRESLAWFGGRLLESVYRTSDGVGRLSLVVLQLVWIVPALYGFMVCLRTRGWRWPALTAGAFVVATWGLTAFAEPLARNLVPIGGFPILFALVGIVDLYARIVGTRTPGPLRISAAVRRSPEPLE
jgi:hypothetical protein